MHYISHYCSPLGEILLASDEKNLTGLWFRGQRYFGAYLDGEPEERNVPVLLQARKWLDIYFSGREPSFTPPLLFMGTDFQQAVWELLRAIPYGKTMTYGEIADRLARERGSSRMSAQAVGGAVGKNPISLIVPCHRVIGADGRLVGYAGGLDKKIALLELEKAIRRGEHA